MATSPEETKGLSQRRVYSRAFFALPLEFAHRVAELSGVAFPRVLMEYTNLYIRFGLGHAFDTAHPVWQDYVAGLKDTNDPRQWTYHFYLTRSPVVVPPGLVATFGCFSYSRLSRDRIRLHFQNSETGGRSPLAIDHRQQRLEELTALFADLKRTVQDPLQVVGASWLYNLDAYRRLFPVSYIASAQIVHHRFQHLPLWGQFLNRHGRMKESMTRPFRERLARQSSLDGLDECFPLQVLRVEASVPKFYEFYGV